FEFMNGNGLFAQSGSDIHSSYTFNNCIFRNGAPSPSALLALSNSEIFTCNNAYFENTSGTTQYNVWKNNSDGQANFYNATGAFAGEAYDYDPNNNVNWLNDGYTVNGNVTYAYGVTPLSNVTVNLMNGAVLVDQAMTNAAGYYEFTGVVDGNYTLVSTCSLPYTYVTELSDLNVVVSHMLGTPLVGLYYLAAEVSGDGIIGLSDYNLMVSNLLGSLFGYPDVPEWRFEEHSVNVSGGNVTKNFGGIMSGDATGSGM
ncbi:MAG: carboxypeptidase regulatory-like domain-containing protein, partial [Bacteroidales bacterium]|nr:carboxypeptidase regulatory-like domain-containing protein [Bacteroidales bacterium]